MLLKRWSTQTGRFVHYSITQCRYYQNTGTQCVKKRGLYLCINCLLARFFICLFVFDCLMFEVLDLNKSRKFRNRTISSESTRSLHCTLTRHRLQNPQIAHARPACLSLMRKSVFYRYTNTTVFKLSTFTQDTKMTNQDFEVSMVHSCHGNHRPILGRVYCKSHCLLGKVLCGLP